MLGRPFVQLWPNRAKVSYYDSLLQYNKKHTLSRVNQEGSKCITQSIAHTCSLHGLSACGSQQVAQNWTSPSPSAKSSRRFYNSGVHHRGHNALLTLSTLCSNKGNAPKGGRNPQLPWCMWHYAAPHVKSTLLLWTPTSRASH
eukprot:4668644-Amphidinium_carterae.2